MKAGQVGILNVGAGDTKLSFDKSNPAERIRAARIVRDMIRRGYALLVATGEEKDGRPQYRRALDFDEETCEYIIADFDPIQAGEEHHGEEKQGVKEAAGKATGLDDGVPLVEPKPKRGGRKRVDAAGTNAVAVHRSAGG